MKLQQVVTQYVGFKHSMGMCFRSEAGVLKSFCRALGDIDIMEVAPGSVQAFIDGKGVVTAFWHQKFRVLDRFYRFSIGRGYVDSSPLPKTIPKCPEPLTPHIYTLEELRRLITATDLLETSMSPLQASTFRTLLLTLYGTGLRISEALSLTLADVNLPDSLIVVRNSKFFKTRLVPIGPNLTAHLHRYAKRRRQLPCPVGESSAFFATRSGNTLSYHRVRTIFPILRKVAAIQGINGARYRPRIHDLRHTFAVHRLEAWYRERADVQRLLPQLSTYLGHVDVNETQRYLTMTPELLREANQRFEHYTFRR
jgi:site-specific recombinase XerD